MRRRHHDTMFLTLKTLFLVLFLIGLIYCIGWYRRHMKEEMQTWVANNNGVFISAEECYFNKGPYWYTDSEDVTVYEVQMLDKSDEQTKTVYFAFGSFGHMDVTVKE